MATAFVCKVDEAPCHPTNQVAMQEITLEEIASLGITPASLTQATALGFALVFAPAILGLVVRWLVGAIRHI